MALTDADARTQAQAHFDAGAFSQSLETALAALEGSPADVELLVLAGRAGVELDSEAATGQLRRATELAPDNASAWHHYGEALAAEGETGDAEAAFRRAVELDPSDQVALSHLGHTALVAGRNDEGVDLLARAADIGHGASSASISLIDMYRSFGQFAEALDQARRIAGAAEADALAWLDVAELSLSVGELDEASSAFNGLREIDDVPGHEAYPLHGLIEVEIARERWPALRELVTQLSAIEPHGLSTELAAFTAEQLGEAGEQPAPSRSELESALGAALADYRRMLVEDRRLNAGDPVD
jgi:protein O-GlcNAc transferase